MSEYLFIVQVGWVGLSCDRFMIHVTHLSMHCIFKLLSSSIAFFSIFFNKAYLYDFIQMKKKKAHGSHNLFDIVKELTIAFRIEFHFISLFF